MIEKKVKTTENQFFKDSSKKKEVVDTNTTPQVVKLAPGARIRTAEGIKRDMNGKMTRK